MSSSGERDENLEAIKEQQNNIASKKQTLLEVEHELEAIAADIQGPKMKELTDGISNLCLVLRNLYDHVEGLWVGSFMLRKQFEILNNALMLVPEIANNDVVMKTLKEASNDFAEKYGNLKLTSETS
ncbi:MAG: hypothetical protein ACREAS_04605 [Nitrososphaera sp.]